MASSSAYYSSGEAAIERKTDVDQLKLTQIPSDKLREVYEIERCVQYIKEKRCKKVALQFPDSMLVDASNVAWQLEKDCDAKVFILADTSYGHSDLDEVNAKHVDTDLLIHYGETSLTPSATIPTLFVFGRHPTPVPIDDVCEVFWRLFPRNSDSRVVFLHHVTCDYVANQITSRLLPDYPYLSVGQLNIPRDPGGASSQSKSEEGGEDILKDLCTKSCPGCPCRLQNGDSKDKASPKGGNVEKMDAVSETNNSNFTEMNSNKSLDTSTITASANVNIVPANEKGPSSSNSERNTKQNGDLKSNGSMEVDSHQPDCKDYISGFYTIPLEFDKNLPDYNIFYLGPKKAESLRNLMLSHPSCEVHVYDPTDGYEKLQSNTNRQLMKRYYLVEKAKDAQIVGILVGTMGVAQYLECLDYLKKIAKITGKKAYTFIMGKLLPEKLANFLEIDLYVLVANPEHSILDASNFYRPVVTPYEFDVACNPNRQWSENYITDFRRILPGGTDFIEFPSDLNKAAEEPTMSLVTGSIRANVDIEDSLPVAASNEVARRNEETDLAVLGENTSAHRLSERSWKGLEQKVGETPVVKAKQGRTGIPVSYNEVMDF